MRTIEGLLLFLFIPLVLFLFLRQPVGPGWSVGLGLVLMLGHRFVAAPWAAAHAGERCLWCGRVRTSGAAATLRHGSAAEDEDRRPAPLTDTWHPLEIRASGRVWPMAACSDSHRLAVERFLTFVERDRLAVAIGIFVPLVVLLAASLASAAGHPLLPHSTSALFFRVVVAATVVSASIVPFLSARPRRASPLRCPFPIHNLFLLGIRNTLWIFRLVGAWWLIDGLWRLVN